MSVLIYAESPGGELKKAAFEAVTYGYKLAQQLGAEAIALTIGTVENAGQLGQYGATKVLNIASESGFDSQVYTKIIAQVADKVGAKAVILGHSANGKSLLGRLSVRLKAGSVSAVNSLPIIEGGKLRVSKGVFSSKAIATYEVKSPKAVLSLSGNTFPPEVVGSEVAVEALVVDVPESRVKVLSVDKVKGAVPLPEAELVVSAGRGMKGPENWGIIEEMAEILGAATACSRPVADIHWRPHHEHVGQTGVAIRPNLYIAIGISGAIQHLAGVNNSKVIVVINKDPEAPFFKAADYGVVADLFDVVPRLNEALRKFKAEQ
jgi:electron transfer flavoprotein alpha subunit